MTRAVSTLAAMLVALSPVAPALADTQPAATHVDVSQPGKTVRLLRPRDSRPAVRPACHPEASKAVICMAQAHRIQLDQRAAELASSN